MAWIARLVAIQQLPHPTSATAPKLLLYLPQGETQAMSLVLLHYLAKQRGYRVYFLGNQLGISDVADASDITQPDLVFTMISETFVEGGLNAYVKSIRQLLPPKTQFLVTGYQAVVQDIDSHEGVQLLRSLHDTISYLTDFKSQRRAAK